MAGSNAEVLDEFVVVREGGDKGGDWWFLVVDGLDNTLS